MAAGRLRIGLLNDDTLLSAEVADLVRWASGREDVEVSHLLLHPAPAVADLSGARRIRKIINKHGVLGTGARLSFRALSMLESRLLLAQGGARRTVDLSDRIPHKLNLSPQISASGYVYRFPPEDIAAIQEAGIDVMIRCGTGILKGDILTAAPFGILSFHHGDNRVNRGGPPGFWEVLKRWPSTGFVLQQLTEELDGGLVLVRGSYPTELYYAANRESIVRRSAPHLQDALIQLASRRSLPEPQPSTPYSGPLLRTPGLMDQLRYAWGQAGVLLVRGGRKALGRRSDWAVSYTRTDWRHAVLRRGRELPAPPRTFLADPFVVERAGEHYCFVEEYSYDAGKAHISVFRLGERQAQRLGTALEEPFHLSFPALFTYNGDLFMCPETLATHEVRIYRCVEFPLRWELAKKALINIQACDTLIFPSDDRWWLLTTVDRSGTQEPASELFAYYAHSPLADWHAHPSNPLRNDTETARNAGLLSDGKDLYRVTQRQGFAQYGAAAAIRKIVCLNESGLVEEFVADILPNFRNDIHGVHHMHSAGKVTVFDYVRHRRPR